MKNKIILSQKAKLSLRTVYTITGGFIVVLSILIAYFLVGDRSEVLAAPGDGTCGITIPSTTGNKIRIEASLIRIISNSQSCNGNYSFEIEVAYNISYEGPKKPRIDNLQGNIICNKYNLWFAFPSNAVNNGGSGTFVTVVNQHTPNCNPVTLESLGCNTITITISGEGIPYQGNIVCPKHVLLPITLSDFTAKKTESGNLVQWETSSEINNDFFSLERSADGKDFETIAIIDGAGNTQQKIAYEFLDQNPALGNNFYRLKQTDFDGNFEYFKIVLVNNQDKSYAAHPLDADKYIVHPNPFRDEVKLSFEATQDGPHGIRIRNIRGEVVFDETVLFYKGLNTHQLPELVRLQSGIYFVEIQSEEKTFKPQRLVKI